MPKKKHIKSQGYSIEKIVSIGDAFFIKNLKNE